jgi:hypothetical protein
MQQQDFHTTLVVDQTPEEVYNAINDVRGWWSQDFTGSSAQAGDVFEVRFFGDVHYSRHLLSEMIPGKKVVWQVTDSRLNFIKDESEWTGTTNSFEIKEQDGKTHILFTHQGLTPQIECFDGCSNGWQQYLGSLLSFITTGQGQPYKP